MADPQEVIYDDMRINTAHTTSSADWEDVTFDEEVFGFFIAEKDRNKSFDLRESATVTDEFRISAGEILWIPWHVNAGTAFQVKRVGADNLTIQFFTFR